MKNTINNGNYTKAQTEWREDENRKEKKSKRKRK